MLWLVGRSHIRGTLARQRMVVLAARCFERIADAILTTSREHFSTATRWARGAGVTDDDVNRSYKALWDLSKCSASVVESACEVVMSVHSRAECYDAAGCVNRIGSLAIVVARLRGVDVGVVDSELCDVIRDEITIDEVCAALDLNPDEGVTT
jgi:hypothetical protein